MKLEDQVCSLELAKRLKELGVKQNSALVWYKDNEIRRRGEMLGTYLAAFTVAELILELQTVAQEDIVVAWSDDDVADHLAQQLCTKLLASRESACSGLTH